MNGKSDFVLPLEALIGEPTPEQDPFIKTSTLYQYLHPQSKKLVGKVGNKVYFNLYWQNPETNLLAVDVLHFNEHIVPNHMLSAYTIPQFRERGYDITDLIKSSKKELTVLKYFVDEVITLYKTGHINFSLWGIPHNEIKEYFELVDRLLKHIISIDIGDPEYINNVGEISKKILKAQEKFIVAHRQFNLDQINQQASQKSHPPSQ